MKDYHTELWLQDKFECHKCKEVKCIDVAIKTAYGEILCPDCARLCQRCETWHVEENLQYNEDDSLVCPECRDYFFEEIAENLRPHEKPQKTPDWWNDLYTDACGNCWSDADPGL